MGMPLGFCANTDCHAFCAVLTDPCLVYLFYRSTLMDVIAGRKTIGRIEGEVFVNGKPKEQNTWSRIVGYVEQVCHACPTH